MSAAVLETDVLELTLVGGLAGFPHAERYALVEVSATSPLFRLRSLEVSDLEFLVVPPSVFFPDYAPEIDDVTAARLGLADAEDALLLLVLTLGTEPGAATANLLAPLLINARNRQAAQVVVEGDYPLRAPLRP